MILNEVKPDLLIEIGTNNGGSALYLADLMDNIGKGEIHTIDIDDRVFPEAKGHSRIKFFHNGWESYDFSLVGKFQKILVIEDASHEYENTLLAIEKFSSIVSVGSYLIVEDGIIDALGWTSEYNGGPVKAIKEFMKSHSEFQIDYKWINMFGDNATFNTMGYLKKIY
jgi:cephalosporin hydroxylase